MSAASAPTLDALLLARAAASGDRHLFTFIDAHGAEQGHLTVGVLAARARALAVELVKAGASREPVLVCVGPGAEQPTSLFGCFLAGAMAVPTYPPPPEDGGAALDAMAGIVRASGARHLVAVEPVASAVLAGLRARLGEAAPRLVAVGNDTPASTDLALPGSRPDGAAIVLYTSGSTGAQKGAVITHSGFLSNMRTLAERCGRDESEVICTWLPHAHIAGLYTRLLALVLGGRAVVLPAAAFVGRPAVWLETMSRSRATLTAAPDFAYALSAQVISDEAAAALDLSSWTMAVSGGEMVRAATVERFFTKFARAGLRPEALHPYYGLTETLCTSIPQRQQPARLVISRSGIALGRVREPKEPTDALTLLGNGSPLGCEVLAVDPETRRPVGPGRIGELWTRGPGVTREYFGDPERTAESCLASLEDGSGPFFRTGDLGLLHDGQVFVTGRLKELIIIRGKNHYPQDIEATVARAGAEFGVRDCAAFVVEQDDGEEALGLAVELEQRAEGATGFLRAVRRAVATRHGLVIHRLFLLAPGALPRTPTRKISRHQCRTLASNGTWRDLLVSAARRSTVTAAEAAPELKQLSGPALRAALLSRLMALLHEGESGALSAEQIDQPVAELGLSSLDLARIATDLRMTTGVEPPFGAFFDGTSLRGVADRIAATMEGSLPKSQPAAGWRDTVRQLAWSLPDKLPPRRTRPGRVLLTGATGFLGAWILRGLLEDGAREVECLVRAPDASTGLERLVNALKHGPGWDESWRSRLFALPGDVALPRLGQDEAGWGALAERTHTLLHNAANVNFVAPYTSLKAVNVDPVHALVALALHGGETRTVHYVSTTAVFNSTNRREQSRILGTDRLTEPDYLYSGYAQSKWVGETAFRTASIRGLPLGIHRPGLIIGASQTGQSHVDDFLSRFIKGCIELGSFPDADVELDLVPVDDVGRGIARAALRGLRYTLETCQWTCPNTVTLADLFAVFRARGHRVEPQPLQDWLARIRSSLPPDNALFPVHPFLLEKPSDTDDTILEMLDGLPLSVDAAEADEVRAEAGLTATRVDASVLGRIAEWMESTGFLSLGQPPRSPNSQ